MSPARAWRSAFDLPCTSSPNATLSSTRRWGSRPKCWNTIDTRLRRSSRSHSGEQSRDVLAVDDHLAGGRFDEPADAAHERRLARAREAHHHEHVAFGNVEAHVADRGDATGARFQLGARQIGVGGADDALGVRPEHLPHAPARDRRRAVGRSRGRRSSVMPGAGGARRRSRARSRAGRRSPRSRPW